MATIMAMASMASMANTVTTEMANMDTAATDLMVHTVAMATIAIAIMEMQMMTA